MASIPTADAMTGDGDALRRASLVLRLRSMGVTDHAIVSAFEATPREVFTPADYAVDAYADRLVPIACGQTMEAPSLLAMLLNALAVTKEQTVLEIGTGSGYLTALLAGLSRRVISLERYRGLAETARATLSLGGTANAEVILADGLAGWTAAGPYQSILVTGSVPNLPQGWLDQLAPNGKLIAPIGPASGPQAWVLFTKQADGATDQAVLGTAFAIPLEPGIARAL
ncbi:MAG: protein-L-isoaspartate(D-aspartate) O-methyltransferase [Cohaesibacteraceae bacterium]